MNRSISLPIFSIFITIFASVFTSCDKLKELFEDNDWMDVYSDGMVPSSWVNDDETFQVNFFTNFVSLGGDGGIFTSGTSLYVIKNGTEYFGYHDLFLESGDRISYSIDDQTGDIILEERHNKNEITIRFTGPIYTGKIRLHRGEIEIPEVKSVALKGFKGIFDKLIPSKKITSDGQSQLLLMINESPDNVEEVIPTITLDSTNQVLSGDEAGELEKLDYELDGMYCMSYTAPKSFPGDATESSVDFTIRFKLKLKGSNEYRLHVFKGTIYRQGLALVAGLFGLGDSFYANIKDYLKVDYDPEAIQIVSFPGDGTSSFDHNTYSRKIINDNLEKLYERLLDKGIVSSSYDLVGYSMGGILIRLYTQNVRQNATYRIITIDTPHYGSDFAGFVKDVLIPAVESSGHAGTVPKAISKSIIALYNNPKLKAFKDLSTESQAIIDLNNESVNKLKGIPVHSYIGVINLFGSVGNVDNTVQEIRRERWSVFHSFQMVNAFFSKKKLGDKLLLKLYKGDLSDGVVSRLSQRGGLPEEATTVKSSKSKGPLGSFSPTHHLHICAQDFTAEALQELLRSPWGANEFSLNGYAPMSFQKNLSARSGDTDFSEFIESFTMTSDTNIWIKTSVEYQNNELRIDVHSSADIVDNLIFLSIGDEALFFEGHESYKIDIRREELSDVKILVLGKTDSGELAQFQWPED